MLRAAPVLAPAPVRLGGRSRLVGLIAAVGLANATWLMVAIVVVGSTQPRHMADFHVMRDAAREILQGRSGGFVYPPPIAFLLIPFTFLPYSAAAAIWITLILACIPLLLLTLGVRDWRC
jgi:hypothetical protein